MPGRHNFTCELQKIVPNDLVNVPQLVTSLVALETCTARVQARGKKWEQTGRCIEGRDRYTPA